MIEPSRSLSQDAREVAWRFVAATGAGAIVGMVVGGIGGRLVMFVLRLGSDDTVHGLTSDDGFVIGQFTTDTAFLLMVAAGLGGVGGAVYLVLRSALPRRGRPVFFGVVAALLTGADVVKTDGIDFTLLDPKPFAIAGFVVLPGVAAYTIALAVERLLTLEPWSRRGLTVVLALAALVLNVFLAVIALAAACALLLRRTPALGRAVLAIGRVAVPIALVAVAVLSLVDLWRDATEIL